jgi:para-nitrobenzyl esterase
MKKAQRRRALLLPAMAIAILILMGCKGEFTGGAPVAGLSFETESQAGITDMDGSFCYHPNQTITFAIGDLVLGTGMPSDLMSPIDLAAGAEDETDPVATNISVLLQSLDQDGHLNNGIRITPEIADIVGGYLIDFSQDPAAFAADPEVLAMLAELNAAGVFTDTDPRARTLTKAPAAQSQLARSLSERNIVQTKKGAVKGYAADENTWQYLGIPYAQPPIGELRWQPPQPLKPWKGIREATAWADQAAQNPALQRYNEGGMSEDCLYLNVTAPKHIPKGKKGLPVMVWFHGGGFTALSSNSWGYNNPSGLPTKGVVQVSVNQRLGIFGYLAHPWLSAESEYGGSGNYGQMDLIAALKWVQDNIAAFGGDPRNVTIFGESGGGRKVLSLMASPQAAGLFHKAISQSGTLYPDTRGLASAEAHGQALSDAVGATTLEELRAVPWHSLALATPATVIPYTNVDGWYLPVSERELIESGQHNDVPFMIVVNSNDTVDPIGTWKNVLPWLTDYSAANHYAALFTKVPSGWEALGLLAYHACELSYMHGFPESLIAHYQLGLVIDPATGKSLVIGDLNGNGITGSRGDTADIFASAGWNAQDDAVADTAMSLWSNFAKTGDPSIPGMLAWTPYTSDNDLYLELGAAPEMKTGASLLTFPNE